MEALRASQNDEESVKTDWQAAKSSDGEEKGSYTAAWIDSLSTQEMPKFTDMEHNKPASPTRVDRAPSKMGRSRKSSRSAAEKAKLELELKHMQERQMLDREARELEFEIRRQEMEMETQRRLAE